MSEALLSSSELEGPGTVCLPTIPTLPPIEIPQSNIHSSSITVDNVTTLSVPDVDDTLPNSAKFSEESYATACSSPVAIHSESQIDDVLESTHFTQIVSPRALLKSLSVDSFIREQRRRDSGSISPTDTTSALTAGTHSNHERLSAIDPDMDYWRSTLRSDPQFYPVATAEQLVNVESTFRTAAQKVRSSSVLGGNTGHVTTEDENESSTHEDTEVERVAATNKVITTSSLRQRLSAPRRAGSMPVTRPLGQLPTQPRVHRDLNSKSKTTITKKPISPNRISNTPSRSSVNRVKTSGLHSTESTRSRSASVGGQSEAAYKRSARRAMNLHIDTENPPKDAITMTLGVVGARGCGKSSFIRRAWKHSRVTEAEHKVASIRDNVGVRLIHYSLRRAYMQGYEGRDYFISLIELGLHELEHADGELHDVVRKECLPKMDGVYILYDASDKSSFTHLPELINAYCDLHIPYIVLACKSDLPRGISPSEAVQVVSKYDGGIVEISNNESGREKAKKCVGVLVRGVLRRRYGSIEPQKNPCSPDLYNTPTPWDKIASTPQSAIQNTDNELIHVRSVTEVPNSSALSVPASEPLRNSPPHIASPLSLSQASSAISATSLVPITPGSPTAESASASATFPLNMHQPPSIPASPTRSRSMNDLLTEHQKPLGETKQQYEHDAELRSSKSIIELMKIVTESVERLVSVPSKEEPPEESEQCPAQELEPEPEPEPDDSQLPPSPFATLDELLEKLFFLSSSGDDPPFVDHFFLTYRAFTTPRRILLAMQKRMLDLNRPSPDPTLACHSQMRICSLLEQWIRDYPTDFATPGTTGALNALAKQILRQPHTLCYGSDLLSFLELLPTLHDQDSKWAVKAESSIAESDDSDSLDIEITDVSLSPTPNANDGNTSPTNSRTSVRGRKSSLTLSSAFLQVSVPSGTPSTKDLFTRLQRASTALLHSDSEEVARELTRREAELFLQVSPREWLRNTMISAPKDPNLDKVARLSRLYNGVHNWASSMVLCHDKPKARAKVVEKLADISIRLRVMNNYSGLRAIITAITRVTQFNDEVMEIFKTKTELHKKYLSSDILMRTYKAHNLYRLALRNTKGPVIPCLEIHTSDLMRAQEGNSDFKSDDPTKVHWAKFDMIGRFVDLLKELQAQSLERNSYNFSEYPMIGQILDVPVMDYEMQQDRSGNSPKYDDDPYSNSMPTSMVLDHSGQPRDPGKMKRIFFWA